MKRIALVVSCLVAFSSASAEDLKFADLANQFDSPQADRTYVLTFRMMGGSCVVNPNDFVAKQFKKARFEVDIESQSSNTVSARFSSEYGNRFEDETFHSADITLGYGERSIEANNSVSELYRHFSVVEWKRITRCEPSFTICGYGFFSSTKVEDYKVFHDVQIQHQTRTVEIDGKKHRLLRATGTSKDFAWIDAPLYYCLFPAL